MYYVYILRGASGRHYIGQTTDLGARLAQHQRGQTHTTKRLKGELVVVVSRQYASRSEAVAVERMLKSWKNPRKAIDYLRSGSVK